MTKKDMRHYPPMYVPPLGISNADVLARIRELEAAGHKSLKQRVIERFNQRQKETTDD